MAGLNSGFRRGDEEELEIDDSDYIFFVLLNFPSCVLAVICLLDFGLLYFFSFMILGNFKSYFVL